MTGTAKINNPGELSVTISLTAKLSEWQALAGQFKDASKYYAPCSPLLAAIAEIVEKASGNVSTKEDRKIQTAE